MPITSSDDVLYATPNDKSEKDLNWLEMEFIPQSLQFMIDLLPTIHALTKDWPRGKVLEVLDVGTGSAAGANLLAVLHRSDFFGVRMKVDAMDISPLYKKYALHNFKDINSYIVGDIFQIDRNRCWDLVICSHTIEHIKEPTVIFFIKELQRRSRQWAVFYTPYKEQNLLPGEHYTSFDENKISALAPQLVRIIEDSPGWKHPVDDRSSCLLFALGGEDVFKEKLGIIQRELIEKTQDYESANQELRELLVRFPHDPYTNYLYALSLHILKRDLEMAVRRYGRALDNGYDEFWVRFNRGSLYKELDHLGRSLIDLKRAAELKPDHEATHTLLRKVEQKLNTLTTINPKEMRIEDLEEILLPLDLNKIHSLVSDRLYHDALLQLDILVENYPNNPDLNYLYAFSLHMLQIDPGKALFYYETALQRGFDQFWVRFHRGNLLFDLGQFQNAREDLEQALHLAANLHEAERHDIQRMLNEAASQLRNLLGQTASSSKKRPRKAKSRIVRQGVNYPE